HAQSIERGFPATGTRPRRAQYGDRPPDDCGLLCQQRLRGRQSRLRGQTRAGFLRPVINRCVARRPTRGDEKTPCRMDKTNLQGVFIYCWQHLTTSVLPCITPKTPTSPVRETA